ncbi:MAG: DUF427 domain-containing protein [Bradymonadia bacterium]
MQRPNRRPALKPGQEWVWDYPRPPRLEAVNATLEVFFDGELLARTTRGHRVLETTHPPVYYFPPEDVRMHLLKRQPATTHCEWKGQAIYFDVESSSGQRGHTVAWAYPVPVTGFDQIAHHLAFYAGRVGDCRVNGESVTPQPGDFYGGWITQNLVGPFKGGPGSWGW